MLQNNEKSDSQQEASTRLEESKQAKDGVPTDGLLKKSMKTDNY